MKIVYVVITSYDWKVLGFKKIRERLEEREKNEVLSPLQSMALEALEGREREA